MQRIVLLSIVCVLLTVLSLPGCRSSGNTIVTFPDPNLETAIREALNKPSGSIYASELAVLASLSTHTFNRGIKSLSGLQYCTNLTDLYLGSNQISDVSPLANLTKLTELELFGNQIGDISALANLVNLTDLQLWANQISDVSPLASLTNLAHLDLATNQIGGISPLGNLTMLTELWLSDNQITDISPLASLANLTYLHLEGNQIDDIGPLVENGGLSQGDSVVLYGNPLSSDSINIYIPQLEARGVTVEY